MKWEHWEDFRQDFQENGWINAKEIEPDRWGTYRRFETCLLYTSEGVLVLASGRAHQRSAAGVAHSPQPYQRRRAAEPHAERPVSYTHLDVYKRQG